LHHQVDTFARVGSVADDVAEAIDLGDVVFVNVPQDGLEGFQVTVYIADDGLHAWLSRGCGDAPGLAPAHSPCLVKRHLSISRRPGSLPSTRKRCQGATRTAASLGAGTFLIYRRYSFSRNFQEAA